MEPPHRAHLSKPKMYCSIMHLSKPKTQNVLLHHASIKANMNSIPHNTHTMRKTGDLSIPRFQLSSLSRGDFRSHPCRRLVAFPLLSFLLGRQQRALLWSRTFQRLKLRSEERNAQL